jgi:hypothetical protein
LLPSVLDYTGLAVVCSCRVLATTNFRVFPHGCPDLLKVTTLSDLAPPPAAAEPDRKTLKQDAAAAKARSKAARPWFKKKRFIIPLALVVLLVLVNLGGSDDDVDDSATAEESTTDDAEATADEPEASVVENDDIPEEVADDAEFAMMGEEARDGQFAFTVDNFECVGNTIAADNEFLDDAVAQGQFCLLDISVENIGSEAQTLSASNQYLYDAEERRFSASDDFEVMMVVETPIFDEINPGNSLSGTIVFDVPETAEIEFAELHDSAFSGGVLVDLR